MKTLVQSSSVLLALISVLAADAFAQNAGAAAGGGVVYENNFEQGTEGKVPEDFLVLDGQFTVKVENGNKILELPGAPLETFGALFGPTEAADILVQGKVFGTGKGRRYPTFAVGANGVSGYRLQVSPGKKLLELYKGDEVVKSSPLDWKSGEWTELRLQVSKVADGLKVDGKAWQATAKEPEWMISFSDASSAPAGRASLWGSPYSGTAIQYDNLKVSKVAAAKP